MKILVSGGAGYIGSMLVRELLSDGHRVVVIDNLMYRQQSLLGEASNPRLEVIVADVRDEEKWSEQITKADVIFPLAAIVGAPACDQNPALARSINHEAAISLFEKTSSQQLIVMPTTNSAYGTGQAGQIFTEESELNPISQYAKEKVLVEEALMQRPSSVSMRLATVFGMSQRMRLDLLVNNFVYRALTDRVLALFEPNYVRNYIHVRDVVAAFMLVLSTPESFMSQIFNVGLSDANLSKRELADRIKRQLPGTQIVEIENQKDLDQRNYLVSNEKIESKGFSPQHSIDEGIAELVRGLPMLSPPNYVNAR